MINFRQNSTSLEAGVGGQKHESVFLK
jgi:hypothetical protein